MLWVALHSHWSIAGGPAAQQVVPLVIETGEAAVVAVTSEGPFGDQERTGGRWLPWLRLGAAILLTGAAVAALSAGAAAGGPTGGTLAITRNVAGMAGLEACCPPPCSAACSRGLPDGVPADHLRGSR